MKLVVIFSIGKLLFLPLFYILFTIERIKPFSSRERNPAWAAEFRSWKGQFEGEKPAMLFNVERYIEAMFYVDNIVAYHFLPTDEQVKELERQGYDVFVYQDKKLQKLSNR